MKKSALVMAVTMAVLGLTACGGSDTAATTAAATTAAATGTTAAADTTAAAAETTAATAEDQGFKYEIKSIGWDASIAACQAGQADGMIAGASITDERKSSGWIFSDGYYDANQSMAVAENSDITGFDGLKGKSVAVKTASMSADYAESLKDQYGFEITYFEDSPTMYQAVVGGQVAACFDDTPIMASNIKDTGLGMKIVDGTGATYLG